MFGWNFYRKLARQRITTTVGESSNRFVFVGGTFLDSSCPKCPNQKSPNTLQLLDPSTVYIIRKDIKRLICSLKKHHKITVRCSIRLCSRQSIMLLMDSLWLERSQQMKTSTASILCTIISTRQQYISKLPYKEI